MEGGVQAGQTIDVRVRAAAPDGEVVRAGQVLAQFWAPGRDPEHDLAVRQDPDAELPCRFDALSASWECQARTAGWAPGTWTVRGHVAGQLPRGEVTGWGWQQFTLSA